MTRASHNLSPDSLLHIYYLTGTLPRGERIRRPDFLGNWQEDESSFLFFLREADELVNGLINQYPQLVLEDTYRMTYAEWQSGSIDPVRIGRFLIRPPWDNSPAGKGELAITLNAGVVFGNGTHPTTRDCLEAMEIACMGGKVKTMYDLGTGTGVLALAGARLGCTHCLALDFNELAARTARINVELNSLKDNILVVHGRAEELLVAPSDLLVANIHYAVMKELVRSDGFLRQKWFILSGLMHSEAREIIDHLNTLPVVLLKHVAQNGVWHTLLGITREES